MTEGKRSNRFISSSGPEDEEEERRLACLRGSRFSAGLTGTFVSLSLSGTITPTTTQRSSE